MRKVAIAILAAGLAVAMAACTRTGATGSAGGAAAGPVPTAQAVWTSALSGAAYHSWQKAPGFESPRPSHSPHGKTVEVYIDPTVAKTLSGSGASEWPVGSKIVKDAFGDSGSLVEVTYMEKLGQGWFYASYGPTGQVVKEGVEAPACAPCHRAGSDEVRSFRLP